MTILGIDPGIAKTGYSILKKSKNGFDLIRYGCIETSKETPKHKRLVFLAREIRKLVKEHDPEVMAIERLFFFKNHKTALEVSEAKGVILLAAASRKGIEIEELTPLEVKSAIAKYGRAEKSEIYDILKKTFKIQEVKWSDDASDAISLATAYALKKGFKK